MYTPKEALRTFNNTVSIMCVQINQSKIKYIRIRPYNWKNQESFRNIDNNTFENVKEFVYLGNLTVTSHGRSIKGFYKLIELIPA